MKQQTPTAFCDRKGRDKVAEQLLTFLYSLQ